MLIASIASVVFIFMVCVFLFKLFSWQKGQEEENTCEFCETKSCNHDIDCPVLVEIEGTPQEAVIARNKFRQGYIKGLTNGDIDPDENRHFVLGYLLAQDKCFKNKHVAFPLRHTHGTTH